MKLSSNIVNTMMVSDDVKKTATVLNNPIQFNIPGYVLNRSENTRHHQSLRRNGQAVAQQREGSDGRDRQGMSQDGINKLPTENNGDLTSQEELSTDEAKEIADSLNLKLRDECHE